MTQSPYDVPELYEFAFEWRDYKKAVDFLTEAARINGVAEIASMVELGCGPGQYCREFARRGVTAFGIDISPDMVLYAQGIYDAEKLPGYILEADFRGFSLEKPVDLACCMMATFGYLLTNQDIVDHFNAVARNLRTGGLYVLELPHPRDIYDIDKSTKDVWEMEREGAKLSIDWCSDAVFNPIAETDRGTVRMVLEENGANRTLESPDCTRRLSLGNFKALLALSGKFEIAAAYGDLEINQDFDSTKKSWRYIPVLRKL